MKILLCCAGGFSTNMLMQNMKKVIQASAKMNVEDFDFTAIPADSLEDQVDGWDVVLVGPQITHKVEFIASILKPRNGWRNCDEISFDYTQKTSVAARYLIEK